MWLKRAHLRSCGRRGTLGHPKEGGGCPWYEWTRFYAEKGEEGGKRRKRAKCEEGLGASAFP